MTGDSDLEQRWMDPASDAPPELRDALRSLRSDPSDAALITRLEGRLGPLFGAVPQPDLPSDSGAGQSAADAPYGGATSTRVITGSAAAKLGALLLVAGGLALSARAAVRHSASGSERVIPSLPAVVPASAKPVAEAPPPFSVPVPEAAPSAASARTPTTTAGSQSSARRSNATTTSLAEEARLLQDARSKVQSSPDQALVLIAAHRRRYPHSMLADERELFAIQALMRAGRAGEAADRLTHFRATSPSSPYLGAATRAVAGVQR